jgi:hypothetical protein
MGYYTRFTLSTVTNYDGNDYKELLVETLDFSPFSDSCKWYDHELDMIGFSEAYPKTVFKLEGEGEDSGDLWVKYFKNGRMQKCQAKIVYDEFDESKLT